nr:EAL domain-containing protein [uncultured Sphaerochaeta sp.]
MKRTIVTVGVPPTELAQIRTFLDNGYACSSLGVDEYLHHLNTAVVAELTILDESVVTDELCPLLESLQTKKPVLVFGRTLSPACPAWWGRLAKPLRAKDLFFQLERLFGKPDLDLLEERLEEQTSLFNAIFWQAPMGITISHGKNPADGRISELFNVNPKFVEITGRDKEELKELGWASITHPDDLVKDMEYFTQLQEEKISSYSMEKRYLKPDGSYVWVDMVVAPLALANGHDYNHICLVQDITQRKGFEQSLKESERSKSVLLSHLPGMAYRCKHDRQWTMLFVSEGCRDLTGYEPESLVSNRDLSFNDLIVDSYQEVINREWERTLALHVPFRYEYEIITSSGERKWVWEMGQGVYDEHDQVQALEGIILDISDRKRIEHELTFINEHDGWTGLYNRTHLEAQLRADTERNVSLKRSLVTINISALHSSSLTYGHQYAQEILKRVAQSLETLCREGSTLCKTHEYRFTFYVKCLGNKDSIRLFCQEISSLLETLLAVEGIGWGIGVVEIDASNARDVDQLLRNVLVASERSLLAWGSENPFCFFDKQMEEQMFREEEITSELMHLASGEGMGSLFLQYQPIYDLATDSICGFEALARLRTPNLGLISPVEFIPITEKTKLIIPLGETLMLQAFRFLNLLRGQGSNHISVSVNVSAIQLLRHDFIPSLQRMIKAMQIDPRNLILEITESVFASNYQEINRLLGQLQKIGIKIAMDDFGTGYSSLARERELNVNCLKIDKFFIDKLMVLSDDEAISGDIISMAHKLGHSVVAEGIEHERQLAYLRRFHCDKIQGYLISRPLDEEAALKLARSGQVPSI